MNPINYSKNLEEGEILVQVVRRHPITMAGPMVIGGVFVILDFFLLTLLFAQGWWGVLIFFVVLSVVSLLVFRTWVIWSKNTFVITSKRVIDIDQHGFFNKTVSECNYSKIQDVSYKIKGIMATIFHFGSIQIQTAGNVANLELNFIKNPARVQEVITDQQRTSDYRPAGTVLTKEELLTAAQKINAQVDEEAIKKLFHP